MGASDGMTKTAVLFAKVVLTIWEALSRVWAKLAPIRIRFNFVWLKIEMLLDPIWRRIEPLYIKIGGMGRRIETSLQVSRKGSALFLGAVFMMMIGALIAITVPLALFYFLPFYARSLLILLLFIILIMAIMGLSYTAINEFDKSNHMFRLASGAILIPTVLSFFPPIAFGIPFLLIAIFFFGLIVAAVAEGCLDPDAFDFSIYMGTTDKRPAEYHHTITEQDARYKQSAVALERVVKKTREKEGEKMEIIPDQVDFESGDTEFEPEGAEMEFEPEKEMEFKADDEETEFEPEEEMEFETEEEMEFEPDEEMEFKTESDDTVDFEPEGVIFDDKVEELHVQHDEDFEIKELDEDSEKTVKDYEAGEQKKEMPQEEFEI